MMREGFKKGLREEKEVRNALFEIAWDVCIQKKWSDVCV